MLSQILQLIAESGRATPIYVEELEAASARMSDFGCAEVETILAVDMALHSTCDQWEEFVKNAVLQFIIGPGELLSVHNTDWLLRSISRNGVVDDHQRFELLVRIIEAARNVPEKLILLALEQVMLAVVHERGPLAHLKPCDRNIVSRADVDLIRRILIGAQKTGAVPLTRKEMAFLFELNELTLPHANHPSWQALFVRSMANFVLGQQPGQIEPRSTALDSSFNQSFDEKVDLCVLELRMVGEMGREAGYPQKRHFLEVEEAPADWVLDRFKQSKTFDDEEALLAFVTQMASGDRHRANAC